MFSSISGYSCAIIYGAGHGTRCVPIYVKLQIEGIYMARVTKCYCDKCGKEIEDDKVYDVKYPYFDNEYNGVLTRYVELCPECAIELDWFIMGKPEWAKKMDGEI